jgi:hypothetical protein
VRRLVLKKERLTELRSDELAQVAAAAVPTIPVATCVAIENPSDKLAACDSLLRPCISYTCTL